MADQLLFEQSNESQITSEPFVNRQVVYVIDQNSGNYNGQIQLDTASLANSGKYASYSEAYFEVPLVCRLTATTAALQGAGWQNLQNSFAMGLKNGHYQLIHSLSLELNNTSVIQLTPYTNFYVNYKLMTQLSVDDVQKYGSLIGFQPDKGTSIDYGNQSAVDVNGHGSLNNYNRLDVPYGQDVDTWNDNFLAGGVFNEGMFKRQLDTAYNPAQAPISNFTNTNNTITEGKNHFRIGVAGDNINSKWWFVMATIRLKDIADFFDKIPLTRGMFLRFQINTNTATHNLQMVIAGNVMTDFASTSNVITSGGTSPLMIADATAGGMSTARAAAIAVGNATYNFTLTCSIGKDTTYNVPHPTFSQCRLYVPLYTLNPVMEEQYLSLNRTKRIVYRDIYQYQVDVSCNGGVGTFNALLTNGIPNPKAIIIIPFLGAASNNTSNGANPVAPYQSPFASEPGTSSPYISLTNFNVQVAGVNVFVQNENQSFEAFKNELAAVNAINGGLVDGLTSGLISYDDFISGYRYYVCDLSRRLPAEDKVPKSIQILGTVQSALTNVSLFCFIEHEKEITVDLLTGQKLA